MQYPLVCYQPPFYEIQVRNSTIQKFVTLSKAYKSSKERTYHLVRKVGVENFPKLVSEVLRLTKDVMELRYAASPSTGSKDTKVNISDTSINTEDSLSTDPSFSAINKIKSREAFGRLMSVLHPDKKLYRKLGLSLNEAQDHITLAKYLYHSGDTEGLVTLYLVVTNQSVPGLVDTYIGFSNLQNQISFLRRRTNSLLQQIDRFQSTSAFNVYRMHMTNQPKERIVEEVEIVYLEQLRDRMQEITGTTDEELNSLG